MSQLSLEPSGSGGAPASATSSSRVLMLTVAYDGTDFHGFAAQRDQRTVQGALETALGRVLRGDVGKALESRGMQYQIAALGALLCMIPEPLTDVAGVVIAIAVTVWQLRPVGRDGI